MPPRWGERGDAACPEGPFCRASAALPHSHLCALLPGRAAFQRPVCLTSLGALCLVVQLRLPASTSVEERVARIEEVIEATKLQHCRWVLPYSAARTNKGAWRARTAAAGPCVAACDRCWGRRVPVSVQLAHEHVCAAHLSRHWS